MIAAGLSFALGLGGLLWVWLRRPEQRLAVTVVVATSGLLFQVVHTIEHAAQSAAWLAHPDQPPWLTPWAATGRDWLALGGDVALGNELLHLVGNLVFLVGLAAVARLARHLGSGRPGALTAALWIQGLHVAEHAALTVSTVTLGSAVGVTTLLGQLPPGPPLWTLRVLAHFTINAAAVVTTAWAVHHMWQADGRVTRPGTATSLPLAEPSPQVSTTSS